MPVHFTGYMPNMKKIMQIAKKYKIKVIEDACQSILGSYNKKNAGTWGFQVPFHFIHLKI